ncbi:antiviral helicase [Rhizoclosmatium globosum]|uniref:Antiviral helicase n=1 Tax=Rhizoclosmatium globosum TaxID=329046 RepID=A0A1Y2CRX2_9FUNG|nr:antiviral helicase [Rhizoclosmatium globosum]|eukprot:ORY49800.1 antiviral helicase [Rhizoclosmatium globosum]
MRSTWTNFEFGFGWTQTVPPGFDRGLSLKVLYCLFLLTDVPVLTFETSPSDTDQVPAYAHETVLNIQDILGSTGDDFGLFDAPTIQVELVTPETQREQPTDESKDTEQSSLTADLDDLIPTKEVVPVVATKAAKPKKEALKEWAYVVDVNQPFPDFYEKVPELAHKFSSPRTHPRKNRSGRIAIALAQKHMTRAIYTSPIKALSNQKFRDFKDPSCLIMTTEILRSMLYRGADLIRDVEFVIFDEVHYVNDAERGVVWEEVIIMLPAHITLILLSATVPNTREFADWVGRTKKRDIFVISTQKRPVPLEHHLYVEKEIYKVVGAEKKFLSAGWEGGAVAAAAGRGGRGGAVARGGGRGGGAAGGANRGGGGGGGGGSGGNNSFSRDVADRNMYVNIISLLKKKSLLPVIVFSFSKRKCEEYANALVNLDLTSGSGEKSEIHVFIERSLARLKGTDKQLPQVLRIRDLLSRGIAVHHGGLLPIIKEMVEILFTRGLVKVLFATETFAMGVNAPARAVVFSSTRKHDGRNFRELLPGEYTQMSGRAGRRGLDDTGVVIIACSDEVPEPTMLNQMLLGVPTKLESQFRLTYTMILNLLRVEALKVEEMIKRSFSENTAQKMLPEQQSMYDESAKALSNLQKLSCSICTDIGPFYDASSKVVLLGHQLREKIMRSPLGSKVAVPGRVIIVNSGFFRNVVGVILKPGIVPPVSASHETARREATADGRAFIVLAVVENMGSGANPYAGVDLSPMPVTRVSLPAASRQAFEVIAVPYSDMSVITKHVIKIDQDQILESKLSAEATRVGQLLVSLAEEMAQESRIPENDWSKIRELEFQEKEKEKNALLAKLSSFQCSKCPDLVEHYGIIHNERQLEVQLAELAHNISDQNLELLPDYHQRIEGRVACEINTADELILTELILENFLADYEPAEIGIEEIKNIAIKVHSVQKMCGLDVGGPEDAIAGLKFGLVEVVYEWARGMSFKEITELTDVLEGSIVRCIVRLDETCREVRGASRIIGDSNLHRKMEEAAESIRRDIVFAASLYF